MAINRAYDVSYKLWFLKFCPVFGVEPGSMGIMKSDDYSHKRLWQEILLLRHLERYCQVAFSVIFVLFNLFMVGVLISAFIRLGSSRSILFAADDANAVLLNGTLVPIPYIIGIVIFISIESLFYHGARMFRVMARDREGKLKAIERDRRKVQRSLSFEAVDGK